ncbi:[protein-PII] uridylyltransferase [Ruaniaceae bacterium KH17]|nr:[protein-PII] uridylyltransferase [Ruaniaceae bacterium KH17]
MITVPARLESLSRDRLALPLLADGEEYRHQLADLVDGALAELFAQACERTGMTGEGVALAVVGSLGRRDAGPASDLDCVLIHDGRDDIADFANALWYPIWDAGLRLDHSVRTLAECRRIASADLPAALGILDLRHVVGDETVSLRAQSAVLADWRKTARKRLPELLNSVEHRMEAFGELAYLIEPDLKEARGGLRDAVVINALVATWLTERPHGELDAAVRTILDVRDALHHVTGRHANRLILAEHDGVAAAARVGVHQVASAETASDALLATLGEAARVVSAGLDATIRNAKRALKSPSPSAVLRPRMVRGVRKAPLLRRLDEGLVEHSGEIVCAADAVVDFQLPLRAGAVAVRSGLPISPPTLDSLRSAPDIPVPWPEPARRDFFAILVGGERVVPVLESLDLAGLLSRWMPEWALVRGRPQRSPIHRHTVDRHLVETVSKARLPVGPDGEVLAVAALLHDIGKVPGGGDHSEVGAAMVAPILTRMGWDRHIEDVEFLVRHHLLLSETATSRDPEDPAVIAEVAGVVGDVRRLDLLAALTSADASAVGGQAWTAWRQTLITTLTENVRASLLGG